MEISVAVKWKCRQGSSKADNSYSPYGERKAGMEPKSSKAIEWLNSWNTIESVRRKSRAIP